MASRFRSGVGYDVHALAMGCKLILGGVEIPFDRGLMSWSDGDVLAHAIMDALLGAAGLGDIGWHFPPDDPQYKGIASLTLLARVKEKLTASGWRVNNVDATILAERPRLKDFIPPMRERLGQALGIDPGQVNVKAGTSEGLGFIGRGEGIAALATALIEGITD